MKKQLGFGLIGLGSIAGHHIRSIQTLENCRLVAVTSSSRKKREQARQHYQVEAYEQYREMMQREDLDVVCICTPSGYHLEPALEAARAGKHLIVEKPLEITTGRGQKIISAYRKAGLTLSCIFQNRFSDSYLLLNGAVKARKLGPLLLGNAYVKWFRDQAYYDADPWRGTLKGDGGAALINQSIHTIDLLLDIMGPVRSVTGKVKTMSHDIEGEDLGLAFLEFENGALGTIEGSTSIYPGYPEKLEIHGRKGSIVLEGGSVKAWNIAGEDHPEPGGNQSKSGAADPMAIGFDLHQRQFEDIADAIRENRDPTVTGEKALRSIRVIEAIYRSSKEKRTIFLENV